MSSTVSAVRAVTAEYAKQILRPLLFIGIGIYAVIMGLVVWIAVAVNPWWMLLGTLPTTLFCVALAIWIGVRVTASRLSPAMNKAQKVATKKVVARVNTVAEQIGTPRFLLIFRIVKDVVFPPSSRQALISELAETPGQLHKEFEELRKLF